MSADPDHEIDQQLEQLDEKSESLFQQCRLRSAMRVAREATQLAKSHQRVVHYMRGLFDQMRFGHGLLDTSATRESAVELISLLENEEQARRIQPDLDEAHYQWVCSWMSSCAYDNLAEATGKRLGYNSHGLHECINDGIQVCRRTGKLDCVKCFREYAADVYLAADDFDMVRHQCHTLMEFRGDDQEKKDRRWSSHHKLAWLELLEGRLDRAEEHLQQAREFASGQQVYLKARCRLVIAASLDELGVLVGRGRGEAPQSLTIDDGTSSTLPDIGEWPYYEMLQARGNALAAVVAGQFDRAIELLTDWDRRLTQMQCLQDWFEIRLRLIAAYRLAGQDKRVVALAKGLDAHAREAQDYLTLRRLKRLLDSSTTPSALPLVATVSSTVTIGTQTLGAASAAPRTSAPDGEPAHVTIDAAANGPLLTEYFDGIMRELMEHRTALQADDSEAALTSYREYRTQTLDGLLTLPLDRLNHPQDAARAVFTTQYLVQDSESAHRSWNWSLDILKGFEASAVVMSVVAALGSHFRTVDPEEFENLISREQLREWFAKSLRMDPDHARNHIRAGEFFKNQGEMGEAERSFARAFRLQRQEPQAAIALAEIYRDTERPRDALAVLDMCLREGTEDPRVAWEAGVLALNQEQYDAVVTYMDRHLQLTGPQPWLYYYKAWGHLESQRFSECLEAIAGELALEPSSTLHLLILRTCALDGSGQSVAARETLREVLATRPASVDNLSSNGFIRLFNRLWRTVVQWPGDDELRGQLLQRLFETGLAPDAYFRSVRDTGEVVEGISFYRLQLLQPLDERWQQSSACLPGQEDWTRYQIEWGVLAADEETAGRLVQQAQSRCYPLPAVVVNVELVGDNYRDRPGIVWQGFRWSPASESEAANS